MKKLLRKIIIGKKGKRKEKLLIGWNEWCSLPKLGIPAIKAKIDTGAKTSALHAFNIKMYHKQNKEYVSFDIHPLQRNKFITIHCRARLIDHRAVMSSNGHVEHRYVIRTPVKIGELVWDIEITLSNRDPLRFRMLIGREALNGRVMIDPQHTLLHKKFKQKEVLQIYTNTPGILITKS